MTGPVVVQTSELPPKIAEYVNACHEFASATVTVDTSTIEVFIDHGSTTRTFRRLRSEVENLRSPRDRARLDLTIAAAPIAPELPRMPRKAGAAWAELLTSTRSNDHGSEVFVPAYEAGRRDAAAKVRSRAAAFDSPEASLIELEDLEELAKEIEP